MILQSTLKPPTPNSLSSALSYSLSSPSGSQSLVHFPAIKTHNPSIKCSSIYQIYSYGTVDYERRPPLKWNHVYKRISLMENPEMGVASVLNQCEKEGKRLNKYELSRIVRELRKFRRFKLALEVYEWMNNRIERFRLSSSDTAIQLDLIARVHGVSRAEEYFVRIPDTVKDNRIYGALLNAYAGSRVRDKAEFLMEQMRKKGYANHPLPFNVMMTLYMKLNQYDQVEELISEMTLKNVRPDLYSYNIWLSARGSRGSVEGMEQVFEQVKLDPSINPNWTTFSTMAAFYIKFGHLDKAEQYLKSLETRITTRDRMPYHYLISLYGSLGNREEVYRIWNMYKSSFPSIPNWGYHSVISALVRLGDIEGAEKIYEEWLPVKTTYDPKIGNLLMGWYVREGPFEKAKEFFDQLVETGGKPTSGSWEILGEGHIKEGMISEALSCFKEAALVDDSKKWKPKPSNISALLELCDEEGDVASKEEFVGLLRQLGCSQDEAHSSLQVCEGDDELMPNNRSNTDNGTEENEGDNPELLLSFSE